MSFFQTLMEGMAGRPQDYVSDHGRLTTNTVEDFHGVALYRDKRTDLGHTHYTCKTNVAIYHKVRFLVVYLMVTFLSPLTHLSHSFA